MIWTYQTNEKFDLCGSDMRWRVYDYQAKNPNLNLLETELLMTVKHVARWCLTDWHGTHTCLIRFPVLSVMRDLVTTFILTQNLLIIRKKNYEWWPKERRRIMHSLMFLKKLPFIRNIFFIFIPSFLLL